MRYEVRALLQSPFYGYNPTWAVIHVAETEVDARYKAFTAQSFSAVLKTDVTKIDKSLSATISEWERDV